jgi:hypothetical protein
VCPRQIRPAPAARLAHMDFYGFGKLTLVLALLFYALSNFSSDPDERYPKFSLEKDYREPTSSR